MQRQHVSVRIVLNFVLPTEGEGLGTSGKYRAFWARLRPSSQLLSR